MFYQILTLIICFLNFLVDIEHLETYLLAVILILLTWLCLQHVPGVTVEPSSHGLLVALRESGPDPSLLFHTYCVLEFAFIVLVVLDL